jgi:hypothetical protein
VADAQRERESILASAVGEAGQVVQAEAAGIVQLARQTAEELVNDAQNKVHAQLVESSRLMAEIRLRMLPVLAAAGPEHVPAEGALEQVPTPVASASAAQEPLAEKLERRARRGSRPRPSTRKENSEPDPVRGETKSACASDDGLTRRKRIKIEISSPAGSEQLTALEQELLKTPDLRIIAKGGSDGGSAWMEAETNGAAAMLDILRNVPGVRNAVGNKSYYRVVMRSMQLASA